LHPIYTEKDVIFDDALLGTWRQKPQDGDGWKFQRGEEDNTYHLILTEGMNSSPFTVRLVKLQDQRFLDLVPHEDGLKSLQCEGLYKSGLIRGHLFLRVDQIEPALKLRWLNPDWMTDLLEREPNAIAHYQDGDKVFVLTATTRELQAFLLKHLDSEKAWKALEDLNRANP
jgi:hypothetical protein